MVGYIYPPDKISYRTFLFLVLRELTLTLHDRQKQQCMPSREYKAIRALSGRSLHLAKSETKPFLLGSEKAKNQVFAQEVCPGQLLVGVETNPGPPKYGRLSEEERWRVVHLLGS